jgi:hypothetical protein
MPDNPQKVIIDTNLWISFLISGNAKLDDLLFSRKVTLIFSEELVQEFVSVALRPKFARYFDFQTVAELLSVFYEVAAFVNVTTTVNICRDPKDNFLLALAQDSNADVLITGDSDLLEIEQIGKTRIMTLANFLAM